MSGQRHPPGRAQLCRPGRAVQRLPGLHTALPHRGHRQLAPATAGTRLSDRGAVDLGATAARGRAATMGQPGAAAGRRAGVQRIGPVRAGARTRNPGFSRHTLPPHDPAPPYGATTPPWSAAHPYTQLHTPASPATATVVGNFNCTQAGFDRETHHVVLDFGRLPFPVLEGQSIGITPPGSSPSGKAHHARQYSVASPRNGERPGYNNLALTVKRVTRDHAGQPVRGVASNYLCDLKLGERVQVIGPFGHSFLMPNHPRSHLVMICTGTGSAPMR